MPLPDLTTYTVLNELDQFTWEETDAFQLYDIEYELLRNGNAGIDTSWWMFERLKQLVKGAGADPTPRPVTDEMLRAMLAVRMPATYREHLHHPMDGPGQKKLTTERAAEAKRMFLAAIEAAKFPKTEA